MNETILKNWHDDDLSYNRQFKLSFGECTPDGKMSWSEILKATSDSAGEDFEKRNMSWAFLKENDIALIVSRISFLVKKMPAYGEEITVHTWESAPQGPLCTRNFKIYDTNTKEDLIIAQTLWTNFNISTKKIMPAKNFTFRPCPTIITDFEGIKPGKIKLPEEMETIAHHKILYSELDANGHTNNSKYINFAIDSLPEEFQKKQIKNLRLNYSKEAHLGELLEIKAFFNEIEKKYTVQGIIEGISSFEAELYY